MIIYDFFPVVLFKEKIGAGKTNWGWGINGRKNISRDDFKKFKSRKGECPISESIESGMYTSVIICCYYFK